MGRTPISSLFRADDKRVRVLHWIRHGHHLGVTRFIVKPTGEIVLLDYNSLGHLPPHLISED